MGRAHEKWHICKCLIFHAKNLLKVYNQMNSGYTKSRRKIRQQKIPKIDSKFLHIELLSREAWTSKDTRFLTLSRTNNVIERLNREIRRRTRVVGALPDGNSALMLVCARLRHVAGTQWGNKKYMNMKNLEAAFENASIAG